MAAGTSFHGQCAAGNSAAPGRSGSYAKVGIGTHLYDEETMAHNPDAYQSHIYFRMLHNVAT